MLWCRVRFENIETCLQHLLHCPKLPNAWYWCPFCLRPEKFSAREPSSKNYSKNAPLWKLSRFKRAMSFFKHSGRRSSADAEPFARSSYDHPDFGIEVRDSYRPCRLPEVAEENSPMSIVPSDPNCCMHYQHSPSHNPEERRFPFELRLENPSIWKELESQSTFVTPELSSREGEPMRSELSTPGWPAEMPPIEQVLPEMPSQTIDEFLDVDSGTKRIWETTKPAGYHPLHELALSRRDHSNSISTEWPDPGKSRSPSFKTVQKKAWPKK